MQTVNSKIPRLLSAAREFNITKDKLIKFLNGKGFDINGSNPNVKITEDMYDALQKEYAQDNVAMRKSDTIEISRNSRAVEDLKIKEEPKKEILSIQKTDTKNFSDKEIQNKIVLCEHCDSVELVKAKDYRDHVSSVHRINLSDDFDLINKIKIDDIIIHDLDKMRSLRQEKELEKQRRDNTTKEYSIIWDDVEFGKDEIKFKPNRLRTILKSVHCKGVVESLNSIKTEYFERLYSGKVFKLTFLKGEILLNKSPGWKQIIETIEFAKEFYEYKYPNLNRTRNIIKFKGLSNQEIISLFDTSFLKSDFLKFLASKQSEIYKIIPAIEYINNHSEESFIFRFTTLKETTLIIWENVNEARATHIFVSKEDDKQNTLDLVEDFICRQDIVTKRSLLYYTDMEARKIKEDLNYLKSIRHNSLSEYETEIKWLIENV